MMNLYICSTLRHLIFSLLKATKEEKVNSQILFFYDYQNVALDVIDINHLPANVKLILLSRKQLTKKLRATLSGKLLSLCALKNISLPVFFKTLLIKKLTDAIPELSLPTESLQLFVFNERNKMSRLFRLLVGHYQMVEDGVGNYYEIPVLFPKNIVRRLQGKKGNHWILGESKTCQSIHVTFPDKLPESVKYKGKEIDFLDTKDNLSLINQLFEFTPATIPSDKIVILATQPTPKELKARLIDPLFLFKINQEIIHYCNENNITVLIKIHPSETLADYIPIFPSSTFLPGKLPLELQILNSTDKPKIMSLNSSAGLGFEKYCQRVKLIPDDQLGRFVDIICDWEKNPDTLKELIKNALQ